MLSCAVAAELVTARWRGTCFRKIGAMVSRHTIAHLGHRQHFDSGLHLSSLNRSE
jgi:hypothetical protein